jgi:hypothetical protein
MTRPRFGKTLFELLVICTVLLGLSGMLFRTVQKVYATAGHTPTRVAPAGAGLPGGDVSVSLNGPPRGQDR